PAFAGVMGCASIMLAVLVYSSGSAVFAEETAVSGNMECVSDWSEASIIVRRNGLAEINDVARTVLSVGYSEVLKSRLCIDGAEINGDGYVYDLVARDEQGRLKRIILDAKTLQRRGK
ncbi:MAG: hypothetical protein AAFO75_01810, partial [Pseudomonadota bacterium]